MSGPKVIRIVTREEIEAICRRRLAIVDAVIKEFRAVLKRHGGLTSEREEELSRSRQRLQGLFQSEKFVDLQKQAVAVADFLRSETERVRREAIAAAEAARTRRSRLVDAARSVKNAIEAAGGTAPADLQTVAHGVATADEAALTSMQNIVDKAFRILVPVPASGIAEPSAKQRELAGRLGAGVTGQSFAEWLSSRQAELEPRDARLVSVLAEIETLGDPALIHAYAERAAKIDAETSAKRRALLTDSLFSMLPARRHAFVGSKLPEPTLKSSMLSWRRAARRTQMRSAYASPKRCTPKHSLPVKTWWKRQRPPSKVLLAKSPQRLDVTPFSEGWQPSAMKSEMVCRQHGQRAAGSYCANQMRPTTVSNLGRRQDVSRLQVRLVGAEQPVSPRNPDRDKDQETIWCTEFERLKAAIAESGGHILIERAAEPGQQSVKSVSFGVLDLDSTHAEENPNSRQAMK